MTKPFTNKFIDFCSNNHTCLHVTDEALGEVLSALSEAIGMPEDNEGALPVFDSSLASFMRGFLVGHAGRAEPDELISAVLATFCPDCLQYWAQKHEQCCIGHAIINFVDEAMTESMQAIDLSEFVSSHGDPSLN